MCVDFPQNRAGRFRDTGNFRLCPIPLPPMRQNRKIRHVEGISFSGNQNFKYFLNDISFTFKIEDF